MNKEAVMALVRAFGSARVDADRNDTFRASLASSKALQSVEDALEMMQTENNMLRTSLLELLETTSDAENATLARARAALVWSEK